MALLGTIEKQPREVIDFDITYTTFLTGRTDTLTSVVTEVTPSGALTATSEIVGDVVKCIVAAGVEAASYKVTILSTFQPRGLVIEDEVIDIYSKR